jgi:hypothetical protein
MPRKKLTDIAACVSIIKQGEHNGIWCRRSSERDQSFGKGRRRLRAVRSVLVGVLAFVGQRTTSSRQRRPHYGVYRWAGMSRGV